MKIIRMIICFPFYIFSFIAIHLIKFLFLGLKDLNEKLIDLDKI